MKWLNWMPLCSHFECWVLSQIFHSPPSPLSRGSLVSCHFLPLGWCHLHIEVTDISPGNLDSSLNFIQPGISYHVLCIEFKQAGWLYTALKYFFPNLEPVYCSTSSSKCCFLTCIWVSQEASKVVWYSHLFKNFPQFVAIHTVKGFSIVNEVEVDFFRISLLFLWSYRCWQFDLWFLSFF